MAVMRNMRIQPLLSKGSQSRPVPYDGPVTWMSDARSAVTALREAVTTRLASVTLARDPVAVQQPCR